MLILNISTECEREIKCSNTFKYLTGREIHDLIDAARFALNFNTVKSDKQF